MVNQELLRTKIARIKKSIEKLSRKSTVSLDEFKSSSDLQDIILHNLQMAIQCAIDITSHMISDEGWEVPTTLVGLFDVLREHKVIDNELCGDMKKMVGFRNIIVHEYEDIDLDKVYQILISRLGDFNIFLKAIIKFAKL